MWSKALQNCTSFEDHSQFKLCKTGATRMRVSMGYEFSLQVADKNFSGEVEDYTVNIVAEGTVLPYKSRSFRNYIIINSFKLDCVRRCSCYCLQCLWFSTTQNGIVINEPGYLGTTTSTTQ
jgi:hypothetical protein